MKKVSVAMITYNHERFIAQAIESVLMQETAFEYEIVIGEDCSTDLTREIVVDFQKRFPNKIRLLLPESNIGAHKNLSQTLAACGGQYVALLEGDDYWTSPEKLQKQADFLDSHLDCSLCFHPVKWFYDNAKGVPATWPKDGSKWPERCKPFSTAEDILREIFIQTGSVMFRNGLLDEYPGWLYRLRGADWSLYILFADKGKLGCLDEVMAAHRKHPGGICYALDDEARYTEAISMYSSVNAHLGYRYGKTIHPILADYYFKLAVVYDQRSDFDLARACIARSVGTQLLARRCPDFKTIRMLARLSFPSVYSFSKKKLLRLKPSRCT